MRKKKDVCLTLKSLDEYGFHLQAIRLKQKMLEEAENAFQNFYWQLSIAFTRRYVLKYHEFLLRYIEHAEREREQILSDLREQPFFFETEENEYLDMQEQLSCIEERIKEKVRQRIFEYTHPENENLEASEQEEIKS